MIYIDKYDMMQLFFQPEIYSPGSNQELIIIIKIANLSSPSKDIIVHELTHHWFR